MEQIKRLLRNLVTQRAIGGFNHYKTLSPFDGDTCTVISNVHETPRYLTDVLRTLEGEGYLSPRVCINIRAKAGTARWDITYRIRDSNGNLLPSLKIWKGNNLVDLTNIPYETLEEAGYTEADEDQLVGETGGYELAASSRNWNDISKIASVFLEKAYRDGHSPWPDAYTTPCIIIYSPSQKRVRRMKSYRSGILFRFVEGDSEISFAHPSLDISLVGSLGARFAVQHCLANSDLFKDE